MSGFSHEQGMAPVTRAALEAELERLRADVGDPRAGIFGPGSKLWEVNRSSAVFLGAGRAALLQLAHPWVATAIEQHSHTRQDPIGRFQRTFARVFAMVFGDLDSALEAARSVHTVHTHIEGELAALLWVHATLFDRRQLTQDRVHVDVRWHGLEQDIGRLAHEPPSAPEDEQRDEDRHDGIDGRPPGRQDDDSRGDRAHGAQQVAQDVEVGPPHVQVVVRMPVEQARPDHVDGQTHDRHAEHEAAVHLGGGREALVGFAHDQSGDHEQAGAVHERREDLQARVPIRPPTARRPAGEPQREYRERERGDVGEHVAGVREQRERAGQHAADRFGHHEDRREREHRDEAGAHRAGATPWTRRGLVTVPVSAVMRMVVTVGVAAPRRRRTVGRAA
jgi:hypothetical protein